MKYLLLKLDDFKNAKQVIVDQSSTEADFDAFVKQLPANEPRWAVYDYEYTLEGEGSRSKLILVAWVPEAAPIKAKMVSASTLNAVKTALNFTTDLQASDLDDITKERSGSCTGFMLTSARESQGKVVDLIDDVKLM